VVGYLGSAGFDVEEVVEREPYPNVEHQSRRAYIFAGKPRVKTGESGRTRVANGSKEHEREASE
jgi:hypothetical protein